MKTDGPKADLSRRQFWIRVAGIFAVVFVAASIISVIAYRHAEKPYDERLGVAVREADRVINNSIAPTEAIEITDQGLARRVRGSGSFKFLGCYDAHCPGVDVAWFVPVEQGKEKTFIQDLIRKSGYVIVEDPYLCNIEDARSCLEIGHKADFTIDLTVRPLVSEQPPAKNIAPKVWRVLHFGLDYDWQK